MFRPLIEPEWNVNWIAPASLASHLTPLIEPEWNVNTVRLILAQTGISAFNRTRMECKYKMFHVRSFLLVAL